MRATIRTRHADAESVAAALAPDNTAEMATRVSEGDDSTVGENGESGSSAAEAVVETTIERSSTAGLQATVDDYLVNLHVAAQCTNETDDTNHNS